MKLKRIVLKGFIRFKDSFEIEFPRGQVTLIAGENGAGKTSILDSLCISLYGKTFRTSGQPTSGYMSVNDLVNEECDKASIRVEFENHGHNYVVLREITKSSNNGKLFEDGEEKARGKGVYDYVRTRAIGLDWEGFRKSTVVLQDEMNALTQLDPSKRKNAFVKLFGLDTYNLYDNIAKDKIGDKELAITSIQGTNIGLEADVKTIPQVSQEIRQIKEIIIRLESKKKKLDQKVNGKRADKEALESDYNAFVILKEQSIGIDEQISKAKKDIKKNIGALNKLLKLNRQFPKLEKAYNEYISLDSRLNILKPSKLLFDKHEKEISNYKVALHSKTEELSRNRDNIGKTKPEIANLKKQIPREDQVIRARRLLTKVQDKKNNLGKKEAGLKAEIKSIKNSIKELKDWKEQVKGKDTCPVCLQKISDPSHVLQHYDGEIGKLQSERKELLKKIVKVAEGIKTTSIKIENMTSTKEDLEGRYAKKRGVRERTKIVA